MNRMVLMLPTLALGVAALGYGQVPTKVGTIHIQDAIIGTKDGQKAAQELQSRFEPRKKELDRKRSEIDQLQTQLRNGSNTMAEEQKQKLYRDIDTKTKALNRDTEDAQAEFDQDRQRLMAGLGQRIMAVLTKYSKEHSYAIILDVSNPETSPVLYVADSVDVTGDIVRLYDAASGGAASAPAPATAPAPVHRTPAAAPKK